MSNKLTRAMQKELNARIKELPESYQIAFYEISNYLWQMSSGDAGVFTIQTDILDMFDMGARDGKDVLDIVGSDVIGFCDGLLEAIPEHTWVNKMKAALNQNIHKKLDKKRSSGK